MKYSEKEELRNYVKHVNLENIEELMYMFSYFLQTYFNSLISFGLTHEITKDSIKLFKEFKKILIEEKYMHRYMLDQSLRIDRDECFKFLEKLDELNEKTVIYYYNAFNDIIDACDTKFPDRAHHIKKDFKTLIECDDYKAYLEGLTLNFKMLKSMLGYEEDFWNFIEGKVVVVNDDFEYIDNNDDMIFVPRIVNLETANINKDIFKEVYEKKYKKENL